MAVNKRAAPRKKAPYSNEIADEKAAELAARLLGQGMYKGEVKTVLKKRLKCGVRTCDAVISAARKLLIKHTNLTEEQLKEGSYQFYKSISEETKAGYRARLLARDLHDRLLGLPGPLKIDLSGGLQHTAKVASAALLKDNDVARLLDQIDDTLARARSEAPQPPEDPTR